ncbi:sugar ABC transporter ATP-binding protein [Nakamurella sp. A5-74]|uniref:Sugar ABC transporter ATP-binding protein n=1 Tax=Nakamurella sp. A5-74 TaxID=3158264 RepID=A0AAU8DRY4_9ACTN
MISNATGVAPTTAGDPPVLQVDGISKSFGDNLVLRGVGLQIRRGEIYGLMGANGAGKSTLIKILCGAEQPDGGTIAVNGSPTTFADPLAAVRRGVGTVHQNPNDGVILDMTVAENLALDRLNSGSSSPWFSRRRTERDARDVAATLGLQLSRSAMRAPVRELGVSERQLLVLARALSRQPEILILDEPTSALSTEETGRLFELLRQLVQDGATLLYVSHKLSEFDALCDRVGVLRDGAMQGEFLRGQSGPATDLDSSLLTKRPAVQNQGFDWGQVLQALFDRTPAEMARTENVGSESVLQLSGMQVFPGSPPLDLELRSGEVTVLLGLLGSGKSELLEAVFGARPSHGGSATLDGAPFAPGHPTEAIDAGVYLVPESRHEQAIVPGWSIERQLSLPFTRTFSRGTLMNTRAERTAARRSISTLGVVTTSSSAPIETLSGGNQQKVVVGRWLLGRPKVLLLDEPFRGVDINARHDIGTTITALTETAAVLVATSDLDEALEVADRIVVLRQGMIVADVRLSAAHRSELIAAMSPVSSTLLADDQQVGVEAVGALTHDPLDDLLEHPAAPHTSPAPLPQRSTTEHSNEESS